MTIPPSPLPDILDTLAEVRRALAYVPQLCGEWKWTEAAEVVDEQLVQLAELRARCLPARGSVTARAIASTSAYAGAARVLIDLDRQERLEVSDPPLSGPAALPRSNPDIGFADEPLW